jgi:hypothetical protein
MRIPQVPHVVAQWHREHPGQDVADGQVFTQPWPVGPAGNRRDQVIYYQYRHDRARRALRGIDEQVARAEKAVAGQVPIKRNRFIQLAGDTHTVNRELEAKARTLAGIKGYITDLRACPDGTPVTAEFVIGASHRLFEIEKSFRMSKHDLQAWPIHHHKRDSIEAHLTHRVRRPGRQPLDREPERMVRPEVRQDCPPLAHRRDPGDHTITAADPLPADLSEALDHIHRDASAH